MDCRRWQSCKVYKRERDKEVVIMKKLDITAIVLTYNEDLHIKRCLESLDQYVSKIYVIDSFSEDTTCEIATSLGASVVRHKWPGNQAEQFNWALDNLNIETEWVLRLDADEYLLAELIDELRGRVPSLPKDITGVEFKRRHIFMGKWVKHGIYPVVMLRLFRRGSGRYEPRLMDEHFTLNSGNSVVFEHDFCDHSLISLNDYCHKHIEYAKRESAEVLDEMYGLRAHFYSDGNLGKQALAKRNIKSRYNRMPLFWRSFVYFIYRYLLRGGFLDGKEGFLFAFIQGWFYRALVDANVFEARRVCGDDRIKIKEYILERFGITL